MAPLEKRKKSKTKKPPKEKESKRTKPRKSTKSKKPEGDPYLSGRRKTARTAASRLANLAKARAEKARLLDLYGRRGDGSRIGAKPRAPGDMRGPSGGSDATSSSRSRRSNEANVILTERRERRERKEEPKKKKPTWRDDETGFVLGRTPAKNEINQNVTIPDVRRRVRDMNQRGEGLGPRAPGDIPIDLSTNLGVARTVADWQRQASAAGWAAGSTRMLTRPHSSGSSSATTCG